MADSLHDEVRQSFGFCCMAFVIGRSIVPKSYNFMDVPFPTDRRNLQRTHIKKSVSVVTVQYSIQHLGLGFHIVKIAFLSCD